MQPQLRHLLLLDADEAGSGFSSVVETLSRRGLLVAGSLGVLVTVFYVLTHLLILDYEMGWVYDSEASGESKVLVMWDKLALFAISLTAVIAARTSLGARKGRLILGMLIMGAAVAMILDDLAGGHSSYSVGYLTVVMILAVGTGPFRPLHVLSLCLAVLVMLAAGPFVADLLNWPDRLNVGREVTYWMICTALFVGISALVYRSRFDQYVIHRAIESADIEIREQAAKLRQLEQLKSRFFAAISHELRTPITLILGPATDTLERSEDLAPDAKQTLRLIERNGRRLNDLVDQLLDLSSLEEGRFPLHVAPYDISVFLRRTAASFASLADSRSIQLTVDTDIADPVVYVDAEQMQKVVVNLLSNAFKFTADGGHIRVALEVDNEDETVVISVKDNGTGIPQDELASVFDRFYQVSVNNRKVAPGSGIGLALVKELVEAHGGSVKVESELGFGSEFTVILRRGSSQFDPSDMMETEGDGPQPFPRSIQTTGQDHGTTNETETEPEDEPQSLSSTAPTVLLVDDHPDMLAYLSGLLSDSYNIVTATDGQDGLEKAKSIRPDLVIADVMMPVMTGHELCTAIKSDADTAHIPIIMVTAKATRESKIEALSEGADDYILKPFDASELRIRVENLIEIRRALRGGASQGLDIRPSPIDEASVDEQFKQRLIEVVEERMGDANFTVEWLASEIGLSRRQLERRVRQIAQISPGGFIRLMRLRRAAQLIEANVGTIAEIAYRVGFNDPNYFSRLFKQTFGPPPSEYKGAG